MEKRILLIFALAAFAWSSDVFAQPEGNSEPKFMHKMMSVNNQFFVWNSEFAGVLNLTSEQKNAIQKVLQENQIQTDIDTGHCISCRIEGRFRQEEDQTPRLSSGMDFERRFAGIRDGIYQVLQPEQRAKLGEMTFQLAGGLEGSYVNNLTEHVLDLTPEQKKQIRGMVRSNKYTFTTDRELNKQQQHADFVKGVLEPEQWTKLEKLTAEIPALREKLGLPAPTRCAEDSARTDFQEPRDVFRRILKISSLLH